jgi:hypothetical protein
MLEDLVAGLRRMALGKRTHAAVAVNVGRPNTRTTAVSVTGDAEQREPREEQACRPDAKGDSHG